MSDAEQRNDGCIRRTERLVLLSTITEKIRVRDFVSNPLIFLVEMRSIEKAPQYPVF